MRKKRWNIVKFALYGVIFGALYGLMKAQPMPEAEILVFAQSGDVIAGAIGGGVLFALFSKARNIAVGV